ncbi:MAG: hypothetical protein ACUVWO_05660 [Thermodesulfobacteriota bacterium]
MGLLFVCLIPFQLGAAERPITINFWPLFHYTSDPVEGMSEVEGLGPFFHWKKEEGRRGWGVRPFFYWTRDEGEDLRRFEFLYPFGKYQVKGDHKKGYLFPLSAYRAETFDSREKWDFQFFPFFVGKTDEGEDYSGLFPIYGRVLKRYGKDEIRFCLWPLYSESLSEGVRTQNILWPFFSITTGERRRGYRLWPLYGRREEVGVSRESFFLWPIFISKTKGLDTDDPMEERMIFPFYVSKQSKTFHSRTILWPLFSHVKEERTGFEQWDLPWPLFRTFRGENLYGKRFFLFYGYKVREGQSKRVFVLFPLYRYEEDWTPGYHETTYRILFSRIRTGERPERMEKEDSIRIWPLYDYERGETGQETLNIFYLFPFKEEGLERNLFPLFRFYRWKRDPSGGVSINLLWGLFKKMKHEGLDYWEVAHLIGVKKWNGVKSVSLLKGLFLYRKEGSASDLRIFYLPFRLRWFDAYSDSSPFAESARTGTTVVPTFETEGENGGF